MILSLPMTPTKPTHFLPPNNLSSCHFSQGHLWSVLHPLAFQISWGPPEEGSNEFGDSPLPPTLARQYPCQLWFPFWQGIDNASERTPTTLAWSYSRWDPQRFWTSVGTPIILGEPQVQVPNLEPFTSPIGNAVVLHTCDAEFFFTLQQTWSSFSSVSTMKLRSCTSFITSSRFSLPLGVKISLEPHAISLLHANHPLSSLRRTIVAFTKSIAIRWQARLLAQFIDSFPEDAEWPYIMMSSPILHLAVGYWAVSANLLT